MDTRGGNVDRDEEATLKPLWHDIAWQAHCCPGRSTSPLCVRFSAARINRPPSPLPRRGRSALTCFILSALISKAAWMQRCSRPLGHCPRFLRNRCHREGTRPTPRREGFNELQTVFARVHWRVHQASSLLGLQLLVPVPSVDVGRDGMVATEFRLRSPDTF